MGLILLNPKKLVKMDELSSGLEEKQKRMIFKKTIEELKERH